MIENTSTWTESQNPSPFVIVLQDLKFWRSLAISLGGKSLDLIQRLSSLLARGLKQNSRYLIRFVRLSFSWCSVFANRVSSQQKCLAQQVDVNGPSTAPVYEFLKSSAGGFLGDLVKWNFEKFLLDKNGKVVERYPPTTSPFQIEVCVSIHFYEFVNSITLLGSMSLFGRN